MIIGTKVEFENLADYILRDYLGSEYESFKPFDVNAFAKDYLKLDISYCEFNPEDNIEGSIAMEFLGSLPSSRVIGTWVGILIFFFLLVIAATMIVGDTLLPTSF